MSVSFCELIVDAATRYADKMAMETIGVPGSSCTYGELLARVRSVAQRLENEGIGFGERVALIGENHPRWAIAYLGILFRGAVCVPIDPHGEIETIKNFIDNSEARMAFIGEDFVDQFSKLERDIPAIVLQDRTDQHQAGPMDGRRIFGEWETTVTTGGEEYSPKAAGDDLAVLIYTSGTTGTPKGVPLTHANVYYEARGCQEVMNISDSEVVLSVLPLFHVFAQVVNLWVVMTIGASVCYVKELAPAELTRAFETGKITLLTGVPRLWYLFHKKIFDTVAAQSTAVRWLFGIMLWLNGHLRDIFSLNLGRVFFKKVHQSFGGKLKITVSAGSRFDEKIARDYHALGFTIIQGYGLTETSGAVTATRFEDNLVGSVGRAVNYAEIKLGELNDEGAGEVLIRGKMVFSGYYKNPEATKDAFTADGWFRSGDLGRFDAKGNLFIVGRLKDVIVLPNGKNIHPEDIEAHYMKSPLVEELAVLGVKDESDGRAGAEKLVGVVVPDLAYLKANNIANSKEAIRYALDNLGRSLPEYQRVRSYIIHLDPLPRTATRKIKRFELEKQIAAGELTDAGRSKREPEATADDLALLETPVGQAVISAIKKNSTIDGPILPSANLEIDLGLDSLGRAEVFAALGAAFKTDFNADEAAQTLTVADLIALVERHGGASGSVGNIAETNWGSIVRNAEPDFPEIQGILQDRPLFAAFAFCVYKVFKLIAVVFFRLEVDGIDELRKMERPFLIAPNHQSFIDPFVLTSNYPFEIFRHTMHVGASQFFQNATMQWVAKMLNVVPIDPDTQLMKAMKAGAIGLRSGKVLNIYPEGERAYDGDILKFKKGTAILATELDLPILPVAMDGLYRVWPRGTWRLRPGKVKIRFAPAFYAKDVVAANGLDMESASGREQIYEAVTQRLRETISGMVEEMRKN